MVISGSPVHDGDVAGKMSGCKPGIYSACMIRVTPKGDKGILANPVVFKRNIFKIVKSESRGIYDMKRGITEVRFDDQFEPIKFRIQT
jgi:hypothetical protein